MAEFALPKHSKIVKGIDYPLQSETENPKKVKKCYFRFDIGGRKEILGFTNTFRHGSLLNSDALGTKINLHAPSTTIAAFRNFCPKNIRDIFQFYVPMSKRLRTIKALLVNQLLILI